MPSADTTSPTSVYLYFDEHGVLIYVGITSRATTRQREHNNTKEWWPLVARQEVEHYSDRAIALDRERSLIELHHPPFNTVHNASADVHRANYLTFRANACTEPDLLTQCKAIGRKLPVVMVENNNGNVVFITDPRYPRLGHALDMPAATVRVQLATGGIGGRVASTSPTPYGAEIRAQVGRRITGLMAGTLHFTVPPTTKGRGQRIAARSLYLHNEEY